jgi:hypothetical protein
MITKILDLSAVPASLGCGGGEAGLGLRNFTSLISSSAYPRILNPFRHGPMRVFLGTSLQALMLDSMPSVFLSYGPQAPRPSVANCVLSVAWVPHP